MLTNGEASILFVYGLLGLNNVNIDISITNLGKLKDGKLKIRPITLLTGPNGTGKSFLTKSLYSILNVINTNNYHEKIVSDIRVAKLFLNSLLAKLTRPGVGDKDKINELISMLHSIEVETMEIGTELKLGDYFAFALSKVEEVTEVQEQFDSYIELLKKTPTKRKSIERQITLVRQTLTGLVSKLEDGNESYSQITVSELSDEIKENFQISDLSELITFGKQNTEIKIDDLTNVSFNEKGGISFTLLHDFVNRISSLSQVVFFESPAYWKVRDALKFARDNKNSRVFLNKNLRNDSLIGVPKYFYDLDSSLKAKYKSSVSSEVTVLAEALEEALGGEFVFSGDDLVFEDKLSGKSISKNLISFGMTNLGMIHALLKNNVITPGSFVFIDEPETNLHPDWQVLLANTCLSLAENDINVVMATHSLDMLKAIEVGVKKRDDIDVDNFLSVNFLDVDGTLLEFESESSIGKLEEARLELSASYQSLYVEGLS